MLAIKNRDLFLHHSLKIKYKVNYGTGKVWFYVARTELSLFFTGSQLWEKRQPMNSISHPYIIKLESTKSGA